MSVENRDEVQELRLDKNVKAALRSQYGVNRKIEGDYADSLAAKCENGTFVGRQKGEAEAFLGVPYAKPPVDERRWQKPCAPDPDDGVYEAFFNGKSPIQSEWPTERASYYVQGEDCLYLNIWRSSVCVDKNKTVMVFFHGGSYGWGGTADPLYNGENFVTENPDIILVTVGYRTGLMGFVDFSTVEGGENFPDAPNLGLYDQIEALRWIKKNIASFGGNPENITIFGESAGGGSVSLLPIIPEAKGLFNRVIAQSGSVALTFSKEECRDFTKRLMRAASARSMDDLMKLSEAHLMTVNESLNMYNNFPQRDGRLIPLDPYEPYMRGETADVDIMIGTNSDEINYWVGELGGIVPFRFGIPVKFENDVHKLPKPDKKRAELFMNRQKGHSIWKMAEFYNEMMFRLPAIRQAEGHTKNGGRAYMYYWTEPSALRFRGACHAVELSYVFGNVDDTVFTGSPADPELSRRVQGLWTSFARTGKPDFEDIKWEPYRVEKRNTLVINKEEQRQYADVLAVQRKLLYPLLKHHINPSYSTLDLNVPFVRRTAVIGAAAVAAVTAAVGFIIKKALD